MAYSSILVLLSVSAGLAVAQFDSTGWFNFQRVGPTTNVGHVAPGSGSGSGSGIRARNGATASNRVAFSPDDRANPPPWLIPSASRQQEQFVHPPEPAEVRSFFDDEVQGYQFPTAFDWKPAAAGGRGIPPVQKVSRPVDYQPRQSPAYWEEQGGSHRPPSPPAVQPVAVRSRDQIVPQLTVEQLRPKPTPTTPAAVHERVATKAPVQQPTAKRAPVTTPIPRSTASRAPPVIYDPVEYDPEKSSIKREDFPEFFPPSEFEFPPFGSPAPSSSNRNKIRPIEQSSGRDDDSRPLPPSTRPQQKRKQQQPTEAPRYEDEDVRPNFPVDPYRQQYEQAQQGRQQPPADEWSSGTPQQQQQQRQRPKPKTPRPQYEEQQSDDYYPEQQNRQQQQQPHVDDWLIGSGQKQQQRPKPGRPQKQHQDEQDEYDEHVTRPKKPSHLRNKPVKQRLPLDDVAYQREQPIHHRPELNSFEQQQQQQHDEEYPPIFRPPPPTGRRPPPPAHLPSEEGHRPEEDPPHHQTHEQQPDEEPIQHDHHPDDGRPPPRRPNRPPPPAEDGSEGELNGPPRRPPPHRRPPPPRPKESVVTQGLNTLKSLVGLNPSPPRRPPRPNQFGHDGRRPPGPGRRPPPPIELSVDIGRQDQMEDIDDPTATMNDDYDYSLPDSRFNDPLVGRSDDELPVEAIPQTESFDLTEPLPNVYEGVEGRAIPKSAPVDELNAEHRGIFDDEKDDQIKQGGSFLLPHAKESKKVAPAASDPEPEAEPVAQSSTTAAPEVSTLFPPFSKRVRPSPPPPAATQNKSSSPSPSTTLRITSYKERIEAMKERARLREQQNQLGSKTDTKDDETAGGPTPLSAPSSSTGITTSTTTAKPSTTRPKFPPRMPIRKPSLATATATTTTTTTEAPFDWTEEAPKDQTKRRASVRPAQSNKFTRRPTHVEMATEASEWDDVVTTTEKGLFGRIPTSPFDRRRAQQKQDEMEKQHDAEDRKVLKTTSTTPTPTKSSPPPVRIKGKRKQITTTTVAPPTDDDADDEDLLANHQWPSTAPPSPQIPLPPNGEQAPSVETELVQSTEVVHVGPSFEDRQVSSLDDGEMDDEDEHNHKWQDHSRQHLFTMATSDPLLPIEELLNIRVRDDGKGM